MKGIVLLILCAVALTRAERLHLSRSGQTCACNSDEARATCAQYGFNNKLIEHENCNQFYKCSNGQAIAYFCPANLLYSQIGQICDWPHNVECGSRPIVEESEANCEAEDNDTVKPDDGNNGDGNGNGDSESTGTCNCIPGEAPAICAADGSDGTLVAHENCNQFYKCSHGVPVAQNCPSGLLYNPYTEQCDWADKVECGDRPIVEIDGGNGDNGSGDSGDGNGDNGDGGSTGTCNCNPGEAPGICAADGSDGILVAHENCNQFYKCAHGVPVAQNCPSGLLYNPYTEQCDWADKVECGDRPIVEIDGGNGDNGSGDSGDGNGDNGDGGSTGTCNCNPGEAPGICAADGSDGILVAHENCNQFYKCAHGIPVAQNCPSGLLYNPYTEQCDWADKVECGDRPIVEIDGGNGDNGSGDSGDGNGDNGDGGSTGTCNCNPGEAPGICAADGSDGILVAHENCNQFYKCAHGVPVAQNCPSGLLYNPYTEQCDWADKVECGDRPIVEIDGGNGDNGSGDSGDGNGDNGDGGSTGTCNCNPGEAPGICAADGSDGILVAHENCNQFYKCAHGVPVAQNCPSGLLYNPYTEQCDWADKVECGDRPIVEIDGGNGDNGSGDSGDGNGDNGDGGSTGTCNCNPGEAPGICAADGSDGILVAHENCNQFYKCAHGVPVAQNCPSGLLYNPYTEQCDWTDKVECGDRPIVEIETGGNNGGDEDCSQENDNGNDNGDNGTGTGTCNCNPGEAPAICAADSSNGVLIAHENCNQFYKCDHGRPVAFSCPSGLLFNPYTEQCDWPDKVECGDRPIVEIETGGNDGGDENCSQENDNGNDNGDNGTGTGTCNCNPGEAPTICAADGSNGVLIAHENCNQFYKCDHGLPVVFNCSSGLLYNPYTEQCDWADKVECGDRPIVEIETGGNNGGDEDCSQENDNGNDNGDNGTGTGTCNCNPGEAPAICAADGSNGVLIAHENCNQFYKCDHGRPVTFSCPTGLLYNPYTEQCDWPDKVECGDRPIIEIDAGGNDGGDEDCSQENDNGNDNGDNGTGTGTCNCNPGEAPTICAADGSNGVLIAHENCNQFYKCDHGLPVVFNCSSGLLYNPYTEQCDWADKVECGDRPIVEIDGGNGDNGSGDSGDGNGDNGDGGSTGTCNCNPDEAPGICAADGSDGTLVAHENCNQFYNCANGVPVAQNCPSGLLYNPYTEKCDWADKVECGDRPIVEIDGGNGDNGGGDSGDGNGDNGDGGSTGTCNCNPGEAPGICAADGSDGILVAHENCNKFYKCAHGVPVAQNCPSGLLYNPYTEQCDWADKVECGDRPIVEIDGGNGDNGSGDSGDGNGDNGDGGSTGTCNCIPGEAPAICAADDSDGTLVAHENCNQFYKCAHGVPVAQNCPSGLLYNPYTEQCDWADKVECGDRPIVEIDGGNGDNGSGDSGDGNGDNGDGGSTGTCNCNPGEAPGICIADGSDGILVAHENCNQFYKCAHGVPVVQNCPSGLLYNPYTEQCDWADKVECGDRPIVEIDGGNGDNGSGDSGDGNGDNGDGGSTGTCNCIPGEAPAICAADGSDGTLVAHENCNQFYKCAHGVPVAQNCPSGLLYNPYTEQCDWADKVECGDRPIVEIDGGNGDNGSGDSGDGNGDNGDGGSTGTCNCNPGEAPGICAADGSDGILVAHENCNQFYKCAHGVPVVQNCPSGLLYNPYTEQCDWADKVECGDRPIVEIDGGNGDNESGDSGDGNGDNGDGGSTGTCNCNPGEAPGICAADGSDGTLVAHENCNQFYKCAHGVPVVQNCPSGLLYNPYTEQCDWADKVECGDRPIVEIDGGNGDNGSGDSGDGNGDNGDGGSTGTCNCIPGEAPAICAADGSDGTLVAHENCNQFYKCAHGVPVAQNCPSGLLYNPYTEQCDWADKVECGDRPIVEIDGGNGDNGSGDNGGGDSGDGNGDNGDGGSPGTCNCNPDEAPGICAADGSDGTLVAHENCNQFYKCAHGVPVAQNCPSGLLYNPYTEQCDWADKVECGDRPIVEIDGGNGDNESGDSGDGNGDNGDGGSTGTCNCNPGEAPGICAADGSDGTLVAHENCNQFYKCAHGVPVVQNCPSGLLYNPYTEQCDWADKVECGDRPIVEIDGGNGDNESGDSGDGNGDNGDGGSTDTCNCNPGEAPGICAADGSDGTLVAHENCNQFYKCAHGVPVVQNCPSGLLYNPYTEQCDWADKVECGDRPIVEIDGGNGDNESGDSGDGNGDNGDGGSTGTCNCNPGEAPSICAADGSDGILVAHENCNQFYKCAHGVPVVQNCPSGLLYNPYTEQCDWADKVECGDRPIVEIDGGNGDNESGDNGGGDSGDGNGDNGDGGSTGTCNCNPGEAPGICAADGSDGILVAHENCNQFYKCAHGVPVVQNCPSGLLYNPYTEQCDWADKVECGDRPIVEIDGGNGDNGSGDNGGGDSGDGNGDNGDGGSTCNCNPGEAPGICAADGSDGILVAHENCNQFYKCAHGVPVAQNCPSGLLYNPYTEQCDWADKVECGDRPIVEIDGGNGDNGSGDSGDGNGDNGDGGSTGTCNCNPDEAPGICAADGSDGTLVAHENCNQFYKCAHGVPVVQNCPSGLLYNPYSEQCDWADKVECGDRPIVEIDGGNGDNGSGDNGGGDSGDGNGDNGDGGDSGDGNGDNGDSGSTGTCNCNPGEALGICAADGSNGTLVAHKNCNQFYNCANGVPVVQNCPSGLLYNPYTEQCDWADKVECGDRLIVEIDSGSGDNGSGDNGGGDSGNGNGDNGDGGSTGTCNCNPEEAQAICSTGTSEGVLIAHEYCNKFYKCSFGSPVTFACSGNLLYNPYTEVCDWPENVDCGERPISDNDGDGNDGDSSGGDNGGDNSNIGGNCDPSQAPTICAASGSNGVLVAHENCDKFYVCSYGLPVALSCPVNLLYNPSIGECDWPSNVDCGERVIPEPDEIDGDCLCNSKQAPSICAGSNSDGKMIAHASCNQFYVCFNRRPIARSCPASLFYDPHTMQCNWPLFVNCDGRDVATFSLNKHMQSRRGIF